MFAKGEPVKIVTFSFDDGVNNDSRLVRLLNRYSFKATFNLNSGKMFHGEVWNYEGQEVYRLTQQEALEAYKGHEIASHGRAHVFLEKKTKEETEEEIAQDIKSLTSLFSQPIQGFVAPFGSSNPYVDGVLKKEGIAWCRGVESTRSFLVPDDLLHYEPSARIADPFLEELVKDFIELRPKKKEVLFIWSHSYEFNTEEKWASFERLLQALSEQKDILRLTNSEALL